MSEREERAYVVLAGLYIGGLVTANAIAAKLIEIEGAVFTAGAIAYPVTFVLQDVLNERFGKRRAEGVVWAAFAGAGVLVAYSAISLRIPESDARPLGGAFEAIFAPTPRIVLGSLVAFLAGGLVDVQVFFRIRELTAGRHLWLRKVVSTLVSQGVDTTLFCMIAFYGDVPMRPLIMMMIGQYALKQTIAVGALPISYAILHGIRKR